MQVGRVLLRLDGGLHAALGDLFKIVDARALLRKLKVEVAQGGFEGHVAHLRAQHVKKQRPFVRHNGTIVRRVGRQPRRLRDRRGIFVHQRADGKFVHGTKSRFLAGVLLGVESLGIASQPVANPDVARRRGQNLNSPPLRSHQARNGSVATLGIPGALAEEQNSGSRKIAEGPVRNLDQRESGIRNGAKHV